MSDHDKAFAKFPGQSTGQFWFIDIFKIEAVGQSTNPQAATIFCERQHYQIVVPWEDLEAAGVENAAEYAYGVIAQVAAASAGVPLFDDEDAEAEMERQVMEDPTVG